MSVFWIKTLQLLLCFALLIILHEGGHFFFSKLFGVKVEKFFMFFDYKFHLFSTRDKWFARLFPRIARNETEYGIGWIPLGGYVKIAGMIDESMDTEQMQQPVQPNEFRAKPVWQRFLIMVGGVLVNFLLALFIYAMILFAWGQDTLPMRNISNGFSFNEMAESVGFRDGDIPIRADDKDISQWDGNVFRTISEAHTITVLRGGREVVLTMPDEGLNLLDMINQEPRFLTANVEAVIDTVLPGAPAYEAGIRGGHRIAAIDGKPVQWWSDFDDIMGRKADILAAGCSHQDSLRLRHLTITITAPASAAATDSATTASANTATAAAATETTDTATATAPTATAATATASTATATASTSSSPSVSVLGGFPAEISLTLDENYKLGIVKKTAYSAYKLEHHDYSFFSSIPAGIAYGWQTLKGYVSDLKYLFSKQGAKSVGSFGTIGNLFPAVWDWQAFWNITAFISIILAVMNILPIPGLDGGHIFFLLVEAVTRRPPSDKFMERAQMLGMLLLFGLMALAIFNDVVKFLF